MKRDELHVGVDLGGTNVRAAVVDGDGKVLGQEKHRLLSREPAQVAEAVLRAGKTACAAAALPFGDIQAMGVGIAAMIERGTGMVLNAPNLGWRDVPFLKLLHARAGKLPVSIANDLSVAAWGEHIAGAGRGVDDLIMVLVGSGIGAGIILGGKLQEGATGVGGEFGHVIVHPGGRHCGCGQRGCLEAYAGGHNLATWARDDLRIGLAAARAGGQRQPAAGKKLLEIVGDPEKVTAAAMERAAHEGDELCRRLLDEAGQLLGIGLANLVTLLNPSLLLLGGGLLHGSPRMMAAATAGIDQHASKAARAALRIGAPELGDQAGVIGAALLARASLHEAHP
jgi:glucokinase